MRVLHVIPSLSPVHGGPSIALPLIARSLSRAGVEVDVATTDDDGPGRRAEIALEERVARDGYGVYFFRKQSEFYKVSLPFQRWFVRNARGYDLIHIHALFSFTSTAAARAARRLRVPYIIRPLGVLNRWGRQNRRPMLKSLSFRLIERPILEYAAAIHYTSAAEEEEALEFGAPNRGAVIPLGLELDAFREMPGPEAFLERSPEAIGRPVVLFLSRLDPKKGLDLLLPAFAAIGQEHSSAILVVAGSGETDYVESLRRKATELGVADRVLWPGHLEGSDKLSAFAAATVYVLPSYSENFGIALVEAVAVGLPCVTTSGVAVSKELRAADAAIVVEPEVGVLTFALDRLLRDSGMRDGLRDRGRRLVKEQFSSEAMGNSLRRLYELVVTE